MDNIWIIYGWWFDGDLMTSNFMVSRLDGI